MRHPSAEVLRRLAEQPAAVADPDRDHVVGCPQCLDGLVAARRRDVGERPATPGAGPFRDVLRRPAVAVLAVVTVLAGGATAAAQDWLPVFRTEGVAPVGVAAADLVALPDLSAYGDVVVSGDDDLRGVADAAAAEAATGLEVPQSTRLPRGVTGEPAHHVAGEVGVTLTFSAERAAQVAADAGTTLPSPPPGLDGSELRLVAGPGVAQVWSGGAGGPSLVVGRAVAPSASSSGVPLETARDYLLSLPGVPDDVAAQLRTVTADRATLPLPVPVDLVTTSTADVHGVPATVLTTRDGTISAVVWVQDGVVTAVGGPLDVDEVLAVARGLR
ncbi:hypothetical protein [uncultured Cellulomonas sp.]|uniref:hypothetical protein n=1 Tax=uncultured Cellulomonas sp. TaxID=189682 RepID=UPI00262680F1|nr:hypothetical protein [uncultured Cellulomonas sp.]